MNAVEARLDRIRGQVAPKNHNARTIAALTSNPGCARRAVMDAAGVDNQRLASYVGFPARFGQSQFAIGRGNAFETQVKANGCAELLRLLREQLALPIPEVSYDNLDDVGGNTSLPVRHARARALLARAARSEQGAGTLFDHLARLDRIEALLDVLPDGLTFDLDPDAGGVPRRPPPALADAIRLVEARYAPECLASCEMCFFCRAEARK